MAGKSRALADVMQRRDIDVCVRKRPIGMGERLETMDQSSKCTIMVWIGRENGVGMILNEEYEKNVVEVRRVLDRVMSVKLRIEGVMMNVVSGYTPQVGCEMK